MAKICRDWRWDQDRKNKSFNIDANKKLVISTPFSEWCNLFLINLLNISYVLVNE